MFQRIAGFCRRLFNSKGFRRGLRIFFGVFVAYYIYNFIIYLIAVRNTGVSFLGALRVWFDIVFFNISRIHPSASIALGIAIGLVWYYNRKAKNSEKAEPEKEAKAPSEAAPEEEIIETTHYKYN